MRRQYLMHRLRLIACLLVMLALLGAGGIGLLWQREVPPHGPWVEWRSEPSVVTWVRPSPFVLLHRKWEPLQHMLPNEPLERAEMVERASGEYRWFR